MSITINGSGTITGINAGGLPDGSVTADDLATDSVTTAKIADDAVTAGKLSGKTFVSYAIICDQQTAGTGGQNSSTNTWVQRNLNTEIADPDNIVSITSNEFTLNSGTYLIEWTCPGFRCGSHKTRLYDVTGTATVQVGTSALADTSLDGDQTDSNGAARVTISSSNNYRIDHQSSTATTNGFGYPSSITGADEIYTVVKIYKEAG